MGALYLLQFYLQIRKILIGFANTTWPWVIKGPPQGCLSHFLLTELGKMSSPSSFASLFGREAAGLRAGASHRAATSPSLSTSLTRSRPTPPSQMTTTTSGPPQHNYHPQWHLHHHGGSIFSRRGGDWLPGQRWGKGNLGATSASSAAPLSNDLVFNEDHGETGELDSVEPRTGKTKNAAVGHFEITGDVFIQNRAVINHK